MTKRKYVLLRLSKLEGFLHSFVHNSMIRDMKLLLRQLTVFSAMATDGSQWVCTKIIIYDSTCCLTVISLSGIPALEIIVGASVGIY